MFHRQDDAPGQGFACGGLVSPDASARVATTLRSMPTDLDDLAAPGLRPRRSSRLDWNDPPPPSKIIRVELASGARTVHARDESRLSTLTRRYPQPCALVALLGWQGESV